MIVLIRDQCPRADIEAGIRELRARMAGARDARHLAELTADCDSLLELWAVAGEGP